MEYEQALKIGDDRRMCARARLTMHVQELAMEVCAVKPARDAGPDAKDWEPVGEEEYKDIHVRTGPHGDQEAFVLIVDGDGTAKACTQRAYPVPIAVQMALAMPLPAYTGPGATLIRHVQEESLREDQQTVHLPDA